MTNELDLDVNAIKKMLPHRYPFLLVDRVIEYVPNESVTAIKNVSVNEPYFMGHFPQKPIMPGVLITEAMAQVTGVYFYLSAEDKPAEGTLYYLVGVDNARFKRPVVPGDQLVMTVTPIKQKRGIFWFKGEARVDDKIVASAEIMCAQGS